jgi:transposase-like protein
MDPTTTCCPNLACPARGQTGKGNIGIHSQQDHRFMCTECHKTFTATKGTAFYRLRTSAETISLVMTLMAHGCPLQAIVVALGYDERTVTRWMARGGGHGQAVQEHLVEQPRDLGQVQADEIRVKKQGGIVWLALAMMISTRLWLAGEVREHPTCRCFGVSLRVCAAVPCTVPCCAVLMACAPTSERCARPFGSPCVRESRGALGCAPGATSAWRRS